MRNAGRLFDGWVPTSPTPEAFADGYKQVRKHAADAGRDPDAIETGVYLTINLTDDHAAGEAETSAYAEGYYGIPYEVMRKAQAYFAGSTDACAAWLRGFVDAGAQHLLLRFATTDPLPQLERGADLVTSINGSARTADAGERHPPAR